MANDEVLQALDILAEAIVQEAKNKAGWSSDIANSIIRTPAIMSSPTTYEVSILVEADQAAAFEFGSGIHRTMGSPAKYIIKPKNATTLAFFWKGHDPNTNPNSIPWNSPKFAGAERIKGSGYTGKLFFNYVEHPGVAPRPYLLRSVEDALNSALANNVIIALGNNFITNVITTVFGKRIEFV